MIASNSVTATASRSCFRSVIELLSVSMSSDSASVQRLPVSAGDRIPTVRTLGLWSIAAGPTSNALLRMSAHQAAALRQRRISTSPDAAGHEGGRLVSFLGGGSRDQDLLCEWIMVQPPQGIGAGCKALAQVAIGGGDRAIGAVLEPLGSS